MNRNDSKKTSANRKGLVDPKQIQDFKVYRKTTLLEFLFFKMPNVPKKTVKSLLSHHQVAVGGVPVSQFDFPLVEEDVVTISKKPIAKHERHDLPIIYEDEDIIAIDKPTRLLSVASDRERGHTAYRMVSDYLLSKDKKGRAYIVHRLDEDTSGVLIFAKSEAVKDALQKSWTDIVSYRGYYAIVEGEMEQKEATLQNYLAESSVHLVYVSKNKNYGKKAITNYKLIQYKDPYSLLDINIETGRKNQIRVQLGNIGHHVIGDDKYGEPSDPLKRLGLHAYRLTFVNPLNKKQYDLVSPMPKEFKKLMFGEKKLTKEQKADREKQERKLTRDTRTATKIKKAQSSFKNYRRRNSGR
ncbi:MAG: RluA family pseudouridine synthase [Bacilli bacterium]|nr:RluA family pseudouridine synthase [Bacilli bacterium]